MSQKKIRFAVVGVNGLGKAHIKGIELNSDIAELACVCDIVPEYLTTRPSPANASAPKAVTGSVTF